MYERSTSGIVCESSHRGGEACEESPTAFAVTSGRLLQCSHALLNDITVPLPHIPPPDIKTSGESALCWVKKKNLKNKNTWQDCRMQRREDGEKQEITEEGGGNPERR